MEKPENLHIINARPFPDLATAIDRWLVARDQFKKHASNETESKYNATWFALGAAWAQRNPEDASMSGTFESFLRNLISPEEE